MPTPHCVVQGECLASIAAENGFASYKTIYEHSSNAALRAKRPDPNLIVAGDIVYIPEKANKNSGASVAKMNAFTIGAKQARLHLTLKGDEDKPLANKNYRLTLGDAIVTGKTDDKGVLDKPIDPKLRTAKLELFMQCEKPESIITWHLSVGHLDPVTTDTGIQARLRNLGYNVGKVDNIVGPRTKAAISAFQQIKGLAPSGHIDKATRDALKEQHDKPN